MHSTQSLVYETKNLEFALNNIWLGISSDFEEVKYDTTKNYRNISKILHPNKNKHNGTKEATKMAILDFEVVRDHVKIWFMNITGSQVVIFIRCLILLKSKFSLILIILMYFIKSC